MLPLRGSAGILSRGLWSCKVPATPGLGALDPAPLTRRILGPAAVEAAAGFFLSRRDAWARGTYLRCFCREPTWGANIIQIPGARHVHARTQDENAGAKQLHLQQKQQRQQRNPRRALSVCIVGSGPSGFYCAKSLMRLARTQMQDRQQHPQQKQQQYPLEVVIIDALPTPYGLARYGVAADKPEVKAVMHQFSLVSSKRSRVYVHLASRVLLSLVLHH